MASLGRRALFGALAALGMASVAATAATESSQTDDELIEELRNGLSFLMQPYLFEEATPTVLASIEGDFRRFLSTKRLADYACHCSLRSGDVFADVMFRQPGREWIYMPVMMRIA